MTEHPRLPVKQRVSRAAAFALKHTGKGFTIPELAAELDCSEEVAGYIRTELERQLADSPIQLTDMSKFGGPRDGWATAEDHHRDRHLYRLTPRVATS